MKRKLQGHYVTVSTVGEKVRAFIPAPLPPDPAIEWTPDLRSKFDRAHLALGRLDSISNFLPEISVFLCMYVRKEAVLSSMIEGTQSSISDLLPGAPRAFGCCKGADISQAQPGFQLRRIPENPKPGN